MMNVARMFQTVVAFLGEGRAWLPLDATGATFAQRLSVKEVAGAVPVALVALGQWVSPTWRERWGGICTEGGIEGVAVAAPPVRRTQSSPLRLVWPRRRAINTHALYYR
ncbi:unnamed protein product [Arctia plantaginis]|uniref:Uncharacterized protein n=1 Tax=Arctia plantaginis TaxID=874455 RepID=A0A8S1B4E4_ARCPL|nr:unnamed protein product [Arctia plantaginis]